MTQIKICGITDTETYHYCAQQQVEWVGFVFFENSPRHLSLTQAQHIAESNNTMMKHVALTVNADDHQLKQIIAHARPDMFQLHGDESPERADEIQQKFGLPVMPVIKVSRRADIERLCLYAPYCKWVLFDAAPPQDAQLPGGRGESFDWTMMEKFSTPLSWMLAGGLNQTNVQKAIHITHPDAVDISSGVESSKGVKDVKRIEQFIQAVRSSDYQPEDNQLI